MPPIARMKADVQAGRPSAAPTEGAKDESNWNSAARCCLYGAGIIGMLGAYGVIQERIMSEPYGESDFFRVSVFLVLCNRIVAVLYALFMVWFKEEEFGNKAPLWKYLAISLSNVAATWCQYEALKYVSFPVQMLGKSFKMMPVMLWSIVISRKQYKLTDWLVAGGVTWGVTQFLLTGQISAKHAGKESSFKGLFLMLAFLACDGFTSTFQEKLFKDHKTSKYNQMLYVNSGSGVVSAFTLVTTGKAMTAVSFCARHPSFMVHASGLSAAAVAGQFFIYSQVKEFGALVLAATMNLRQVVSILVSYIMYSHPISFPQVVGLLLVFGALFYKSYLGFVAPTKPKTENTHVKLPEQEAIVEVEMQKRVPEPQTLGAGYEAGRGS
uniref:Sugar phosphate transporter domain-containing protein n=1 Tax=Alexandrium monilatum TaxID=311494 RepID=A0A7S4W7X3_9DINO